MADFFSRSRCANVGHEAEGSAFLFLPTAILLTNGSRFLKAPLASCRHTRSVIDNN
jgi:hypothetical protein